MRPHILRVLSFPAAAVTLLTLAPPGAGTAGAAALAAVPMSAPAHCIVTARACLRSCQAGGQARDNHCGLARGKHDG
jgi:hypothetical protein